jgi:site-specific DNA recombinase
MYLRRSSPGEEAKDYSLEDQQRDIERRWDEYSSHLLIHIFKDPGGKSYELNRPVFQQLLVDAKAKKFDIVVVGRWDRFSRVQDQQSVAVYMLEKYGVRVVSATQPIAKGPLGTAQRNLYGFASETELNNIRERTYGGKWSRVHDNKLPAIGRALYGYRFPPPTSMSSKEWRTRYIVDEETAPVVVKIHQLYFDGLTIRAISKRLANEVIPTPSQVWERRGELPERRTAATIWQHSTIAKILTNRAYIGEHVGFRTVKTTKTAYHPVTSEPVEYTSYVDRDVESEDRVAYGADVCPPIVDAAIFHANQESLKRNKEQASRNVKDPEIGLLRHGVGKCGYCDCNLGMYFHKQDGHYRYWCNSSARRVPCAGAGYSWRADELDDQVWRFFVKQFDDPELIRKKVEMWKADRRSGRSVEHDQIAALRDQIQLAERRARNATSNSLDAESEEDRGEWARVAQDEARRARGLKEDQARLQSALNYEAEQEATVDLIVASGDQIRARLAKADFDSKRRFFHAFGVKVTIKSRQEPKADQLVFAWNLGAVYSFWVQSILFNAGTITDHNQV